MRLRKINRVVHRDLGYFFCGTTIIYAISGLAVNHVGDWNPSFIIARQTIQVEANQSQSDVTKQWVLDVLEPLGEKENFRQFDFPSSKKVKIYIEDGALLIHLETGVGEYETVRRRLLFYQFNHLHLFPKGGWLIFSDLFAIGLCIISITGLFILRGKNGITRRGAVLVAAGLVVPVTFMFLV